MLKNREKESRVTERPEDLEVAPPAEKYNLIEPFDIFTGQENDKRNVLLILNQAIKNIDLRKLWKSSRLCICADGGANRLYDYFTNDEERKQFIPQFIVGDCDSLRDKTEIYYQEKGTVIIKQATQYSTDYMKAIDLIKLYFYSDNLRSKLYELPRDSYDGLSVLVDDLSVDSQKGPKIKVHILGAVGGRFDQTIHSFNQLYRMKSSDPFLQQIFITETDFIFLLSKGINYITYPGKSSFSNSKTPICGLLPIGTSTTRLTTFGLKYDIENWESSMKTQVSSSNALCGTTGVVVLTTDDICFNIAVDYFQETR